MAIQRYLAMTAAEIASCGTMPRNPGYMACHFSPYGTGLSNRPAALPDGTMLILNDRIPFRGHEPGRIVSQLRETVETLHCCSVLLDFEQPDIPAVSALVEMITQALPCPVGVSGAYAQDVSGPVFLPPVPCDTAPGDWLAPWNGREIWLEAAFSSMGLRLTADGCEEIAAVSPDWGMPVHSCAGLHCRYQILHGTDDVTFSLHRDAEALESLIVEAEQFGVSRVIGLYQELRGIWI